MKPKFSKPTKRLLAERVGHECSNPDCGVRTSGPAQAEQRSVNLGEAAHINGCFPRRPRYKEGISESELNSYANGIWICRKCHKLIDSDESGYSSTLLEMWKQQAERTALLRNSSVLSENTYRLGDAIRSSLRIHEQYYESLDPRLEVNLTAEPEQIRGQIIPREDVQVRAYGRSSQDIDTRIKEGRSFTIDGWISGSRLFDHVFGDEGTIEFIVESNSVSLDFVSGGHPLLSGQFNVYKGTQYVRVCSEDSFPQIEIELLLPIQSGGRLRFNLKFRETLECGKRISEYIGYRKAITLFDAIKRDGIEVFLNDGLTRYPTGILNGNDQPTFDHTQQFIFDLCRIDAIFPEIELVVPTKFTSDEKADIFFIARLLEGKSASRRIPGGLSLQFEGDTTYFEKWKSSRERGHIMLHYKSGEVTSVLDGKPIPFPKHTLHFRNFVVSDIELADQENEYNRVTLAPATECLIEQVLVPGFGHAVPVREDLIELSKG